MGKPKAQITAAQIAELRTASDREMERRHGFGQGVWRRVRREHGIARFREPTVVNGVPNCWAERKPAAGGIAQLPSGFWRAPDPQRDYSVAAEAARFLQRERFPNVYNRAKVGLGEGWQVGRAVMSAAEMIGKASRLGFKAEAWMGGGL